MNTRSQTEWKISKTAIVFVCIVLVFLAFSVVKICEQVCLGVESQWFKPKKSTSNAIVFHHSRRASHDLVNRMRMLNYLRQVGMDAEVKADY